MMEFFDKIKEFILSSKGSYGDEIPSDIPVLRILAEKNYNKQNLTVHEMADLKDTYDILTSYRNDKIVLVKIGNELKKNPYAMKKAVESFKMTAETRNGTVAGLDENWLILLPETVGIES